MSPSLNRSTTAILSAYHNLTIQSFIIMATKKNKNMEVSKAKPTSIASQESQAAAIDEMDYESTQSRTVPNGLDSTGYETHKWYRSQQHFGRNALVSAQKGIEEIAIYDREPGNEGNSTSHIIWIALTTSRLIWYRCNWSFSIWRLGWTQRQNGTRAVRCNSIPYRNQSREG